MLEALRRDRERCIQTTGHAYPLGFWVVATYRLGVWARSLPWFPGILFRALRRLVDIPWQLFLHVEIHAARIGPGFVLIHPHAIIIGPGVEIGSDCLVFHEVTIGTNAAGLGVPRVGDRVDVYAGARILGRVDVGSDCMIGANCVVTRHVPPSRVVMLPPPRTLPRGLLTRRTDARGDG